MEKRRKTRATQELELAEKDILATMTKLKEDQPDLTHNEIVNMQQEAEAQLEGQVEIPIDVLHKYEKRAAKVSFCFSSEVVEVVARSTDWGVSLSIDRKVEDRTLGYAGQARCVSRRDRQDQGLLAFPFPPALPTSRS